MADISNLNSGNSSSSSYSNNYPVNNNVNSVAKQSTNSGAGYEHNWKRMPRPFGLNVRVPNAPVGVRTQTLIKDLIKEMAMAPIQPVVDYFKNNENVFNGNVSAEIESLEKQQKITVELLQDSDEVVMQAEAPSFMMDM